MGPARWMLAVDERRGNLFRIDRTEAGTIRVELRDDIHEEWEEREHGRPSPRFGKGSNCHASDGHETETRRTRFAKETAVWLDQQIEQLGIVSGIAVLAPPRFLGALRKAWPPRLALRVDEHRSDLAHLTPADLARHPAIEELMSDD